MATVNIPDSPLTWDINYTWEGDVATLYFEGRTIYTKVMNKDWDYDRSRDTFLDIVADKLSKLLED